MNHNVKATYVKYLGWFNGNPATLHPLGPVEASKNYVSYMGGAQNIIKRARADYAQGNYRWVSEVMNHVVFAEPDNQEAKNLAADSLEQLGYQAECGPWRNFYLSGAQELRNGVQRTAAAQTASPDTIRAMDTGLFFDYLGIRLNGEKAVNESLVLNFSFSDINKTYLVVLENGSLHNIEGYQSDSANANIALTRETLNQIILKQTSLEDAVKGGEVTIKGDDKALERLLGFLDTFDFWFNIVEPN